MFIAEVLSHRSDLKLFLDTNIFDFSATFPVSIRGFTVSLRDYVFSM